MASKLQLKVFNPQGEYVAACQHAEDAGVLVASYGDGATVRLGHAKKDTFWTEGANGRYAGNNYGYVVDALNAHVANLRAKWEEQRARAEANYEAMHAAKRAAAGLPPASRIEGGQ